MNSPPTQPCPGPARSFIETASWAPKGRHRFPGTSIFRASGQVSVLSPLAVRGGWRGKGCEWPETSHPRPAATYRIRPVVMLGPSFLTQFRFPFGLSPHVHGLNRKCSVPVPRNRTKFGQPVERCCWARASRWGPMKGAGLAAAAQHCVRVHARNRREYNHVTMRTEFRAELNNTASLPRRAKFAAQ
jgi:hypothetical protein